MTSQAGFEPATDALEGCGNKASCITLIYIQQKHCVCLIICLQLYETYTYLSRIISFWANFGQTLKHY